MLRRFNIYIVVMPVMCLLMTQVSHAATLSFSPASTKVSSGNIVSVKVVVNAGGQAINTVGTTINFPTDLLQVMSVSKSSSILSLWVQDPAFSNSLGTITFTGGLPNPGYSGSNGEIVSIVFKAKKQGTASLVFSDSSVLLNDGLGTDALTGSGVGSITITSAASLEVPTIDTSANSLPAKPIVTSSTHPNQDVWYPATTATFSWSASRDITSIQTLLSKDPAATPTVAYDSSVSQRTVSSITDGILYFHIRYMNNIGWGPIAHYRVQIDSTPPEKFVPKTILDGVNTALTLNAVDKTSGIDSYTIGIDSDPVINVSKNSLINEQFVLPARNQGTHNLTVIAYDKAGNHTEADAIYTAPVVVPPSIAVYAKNADAQSCELSSVGCDANVSRNQTVIVKGQTKYPALDIVVSVQTENGNIKTYNTKSDSSGNYSLETNPLDTVGSVSVWSQLAFSNNTKGPISDKVTLYVNDGLIVKTSKSVIYGSPFIIFAIVLITAILFVLYYGWHKFFGLRRKLRKETSEIIEDTHRALNKFKDELSNQLNALEKMKIDRDLNKKEEKIFKELKNSVDSIEDFIEKKIKKIK